MERSEMRDLVAAARVGRLATVGVQGRPHLVPCVFALVGDSAYTVVDRKPKRTRELARLGNVRRDPRVSLLVDHYEDDWSSLWWVRLDGRARILGDDEEARAAHQHLAAKYEQYRSIVTDDYTIVIDIERWVGWSA